MSGSANKSVNVYGLASILVSLDGGTTFNLLGTTRDGVNISSDGFFNDVHNDENGGDAGPPVEVQYLGETHRVRVELTKYDPLVAAKLEDHYGNTGTVGQPAAAGTLLFANSYSGDQIFNAIGGGVQVQIQTANAANAAGDIPANMVRTYTTCLIRDAIEVNRGTKFSTFVLTFTAYKVSGSAAIWTGTDIT